MLFVVVCALARAMCVAPVVMWPCVLRLQQMHVLVEMDNSGLVPLLEADRYEDLARMYQQLKRVAGGLALVQQVTTNDALDCDCVVALCACKHCCYYLRMRVEDFRGRF